MNTESEQKWEGVLDLYPYAGRGQCFGGVQFTWASGSFVVFWMDDLSLIYWWIALTKVWLSKARKKNAISHSNEGMSVSGGKTWYLAGYRKHWNDTLVKVLICVCVCVCVCVHYIVILTQWDMTKKSHFLDNVWVIWWKWDCVMKVPVTNKMMW